jgi:hypothetical protein
MANRAMVHWSSTTILLVLLASANRFVCAQERQVAPTPPMGWNSWDAFGESVKESDIRATAEWMANHLKPYGWEYVVVDSGWYVNNHAAGYNAKDAQFSMDGFGRYTPATNTISSAEGGKGFRPLADYVHGLGLKFGLHILRGTPREAVEKNLPIEGSHFHAQDAVDSSDTCPWNPFNYGLDATKPAAQAYYDSLVKQFSEWGVDYVKVDCIASHPYKGEEIRLLSQALKKADRPMVLSLSPGPAPLEKAEEMAKHAQLWRISDDQWDVWQSNENFPQGVNNQFERLAAWAIHARPGNWPDADMLAIGELRPAPGWGEPRTSRLTKDEQRTLLTLWAIAHSPLIIGGNLLLCDEWTKSLLTNAEVIAVDQHSRGNHAVETTAQTATWMARPASGPGYYIAVFNRSDSSQTLHYDFRKLGIPESPFELRDIWEHKDLGTVKGIDVKLPAHASAMYLVRPHDK